MNDDDLKVDDLDANMVAIGMEPAADGNLYEADFINNDEGTPELTQAQKDELVTGVGADDGTSATEELRGSADGVVGDEDPDSNADGMMDALEAEAVETENQDIEE